MRAIYHQPYENLNPNSMSRKQEIVIQERIARAIYLVRDQKVMMDSELAELYGVETRALNQAVKRNIARFPEDFMFQLTKEEWDQLRLQIASFDDEDALRSQIVTLEDARGRHRKYLPYVFTEQGVAMLSSVINSPTAIQVNISIMRVFVNMRKWAANYEDLLKKIEDLNQSQGEQSLHIQRIYKIIEELIRPARQAPRTPIGYKRKS